MTRSGETKKRELQDESDTKDKIIADGDQKATFSITRLIDYNSKGMKEWLREFRSDLQEENNEREARKRQHNQLIIQNQQMQPQQSQAIQALQQ